MPVPHTFTSGALGLATKWSASSMHAFKAPWPAPSPRTAWPSMYAFWLMSSLVFRISAAGLQDRSEARISAATFMLADWIDWLGDRMTEGSHNATVL